MIKIIPETYSAIESTLRAANGSAKAHTYTSGESIAACAVRAEQALEELGLPKTHRAGAIVIFESGGYLAKAYDNRAIQTRVTLRRRSAGWYLDSAQRAALHPGRAGRTEIDLTAEQDAWLIKQLRTRYSIQSPAQAVA